MENKRIPRQANKRFYRMMNSISTKPQSNPIPLLATNEIVNKNTTDKIVKKKTTSTLSNKNTINESVTIFPHPVLITLPPPTPLKSTFSLQKSPFFNRIIMVCCMVLFCYYSLRFFFMYSVHWFHVLCCERLHVCF